MNVFVTDICDVRLTPEFVAEAEALHPGTHDCRKFDWETGEWHDAQEPMWAYQLSLAITAYSMDGPEAPPLRSLSDIEKYGLTR